MKAVKCDICGKILDANKEQVFFEIHRLYKLNPYDELIATLINQKNWEDNMIPNEVLKNMSYLK